jgi:hypothetical protein
MTGIVGCAQRAQQRKSCGRQAPAASSFGTRLAVAAAPKGEGRSAQWHTFRVNEVSLPLVFWRAVEAVHAVVYFAPDARATYDAIGLRSFWMGYFASPSAALGRRRRSS